MDLVERLKRKSIELKFQEEVNKTKKRKVTVDGKVKVDGEIIRDEEKNKKGRVKRVSAESKAEAQEGNVETFEEMGLKDEVLKGIYGAGFVRPSTVQKRAIVPIMGGRDVVVQSQSGTGKTATFTIGMLSRIDESSSATQAVVLAPTRELAEQIGCVVRLVSQHMRGVHVQCVVGGIWTAGDDARRLQGGGVQVVVGTVGRVRDLMRRGVLKTRRVRMLVIDEGDEMLEHGFQADLAAIVEAFGQPQVVLVSATLPESLQESIAGLMRSPLHVLLEREQLTLDEIAQRYVMVESEEWKFETLCELYEALSITQCVIFVKSRRKCEWLAQNLRAQAFEVSMIHGRMDQPARDHVMAQFRAGSARVLVATDVWGRGIDIAQVSHVINYDMPPSREAYLHRIGRSGRFGRRGHAITFATAPEIRAIHDLERFYSTSIPELSSLELKKQP